jgi:2-oxoisovalerate dehydrogenase E1 component
MGGRKQLKVRKWNSPVCRIGAMDTFVAYQPLLEDAILPQPDTILKAIVDLKAY